MIGENLTLELDSEQGSSSHTMHQYLLVHQPEYSPPRSNSRLEPLSTSDLVGYGTYPKCQDPDVTLSLHDSLGSVIAVSSNLGHPSFPYPLSLQ